MNEPRYIALGRLRIAPQAALAGAAALIFVAISIWWLLFDRRLPGGGDPGRHLSLAMDYGDLLRDNDLWGLLTTPAAYGPELFYPPLVHLVAAVPSALGLAIEDWGTIAVNLVFVPLLAAGCYGVGRLVYGPTAGLLAAIFALCTPMVLSLFHVLLLDAPLAALVAVSLWALLASHRFSARGPSIAAGALIGLATMAKPTAPLFLAGTVLVMMAGGGWRNWRNAGLAVLAGAAVCAPYYLQHLDLLTETTRSATSTAELDLDGEAGFVEPESRLSLDRLAYYAWNALNVQYFAPFLALFTVGLAVAARELRSRPHLPELLAGLLLGFTATSMLAIRDPRYTLPLVVFVAVIATGWIAITKRGWLAALGAAVLAGAAILNLSAQTVSGMPTARLSLPGDEEIVGDEVDAGAVRLIDARGYVVGPPRSDPLWHDLLAAAEQRGFDTASIVVREAPLWGTDQIGFFVMADHYGISDPGADAEPPADLVINVWYTNDGFWVERFGLPDPCGHIDEGSEPMPGSDPVALSVTAGQRHGDAYRWFCDF